MTLQRQKELIIVGIASLYSLFYFMLVALLLRGQAVSTVFGIVVAVAGLLWVAVIAAALAFASRRLGVSMALAIIPAVVVILVGRVSIEAIIGGILLAAFILIGRSVVAKDMENRLKFAVRPIFWSGSRVLLFGLLVAIITLALPIVTTNIRGGEVGISRAYTDTLLRPAAPLIEKYIPQYTPDKTVNQIISAQIAEQGEELPPGYTLPPDQHAQVLEELSKQLGIPLIGNETIPDIVAAWINVRIQRLANQNSILLVIILVVLVLLTLRALIPLLLLPVILFVKTLVYISERIGLVALMKTQVTIERLHL